MHVHEIELESDLCAQSAKTTGEHAPATDGLGNHFYRQLPGVQRHGGAVGRHVKHRGGGQKTRQVAAHAVNQIAVLGRGVVIRKWHHADRQVVLMLAGR